MAEHGSDVWWAASIEELLPAEVRVCLCVWGRGGGGALPLGEGRMRSGAAPAGVPPQPLHGTCAHVVLMTSTFVAEHGSDVWWAASIEELLPAEVSKTLGCN